MIVVLIAFMLEGLICYFLDFQNMGSGDLEYISIFLLIVNAILLLCYILKKYWNYSDIVRYSLILSLILKVFLVLWDYYGTGIFILPNSHADSEGYHRMAILYATGEEIVDNYDLVVGTIYKYFGIQRITAQFFNVILSFLGISLLDKTIKKLDIDINIQNLVLVLSALLPNYLIISSILIRECIISVILSASLYLFAIWWKNNNIYFFVLALLVSFATCYFHSGAIAVTIGIAISVVLTKYDYIEKQRKVSISARSIIIAIVFTIGFMYLFNKFSDTLLWKFKSVTTGSVDEYISDHNFYEGAEQDSSKYYAGVSGYSGLTGILINSPIRMIYFLWVPMLWDIRGLSDIIAFIGSSLFYGGTATVSLFYVLRKSYDKENKAKLVAFFIIALCGAFVFAWGTESAGSALRHREKFYYVYLELFAVLMEIRKRLHSLKAGQ